MHLYHVTKHQNPKAAQLNRNSGKMQPSDITVLLVWYWQVKHQLAEDGFQTSGRTKSFHTAIVSHNNVISVFCRTACTYERCGHVWLLSVIPATKINLRKDMAIYLQLLPKQVHFIYKNTYTLISNSKKYTQLIYVSILNKYI